MTSFRDAATAGCLCSAHSEKILHPQIRIAGWMTQQLSAYDHPAACAGGEATYGSYEGLARNPDVDLVYVNAIHTTHKDMSVLMLEHGKHVLSEKPIAVSRDPNYPDLEADLVLSHL